jgi:dUTP pyrophosphatase
MNGVLTKSDIRRLIQQNPPLLEGYVDLEAQLQPNGLDMTIRDIASMNDAGQIAASDKDRKLSKTTPLNFDASGFVDLKPGPYMVTYNEIVTLPVNVMALARPRSSLLRCGVTVGAAVWDAGYSGRSQSLLVVYNPHGFRLQKNARILQLVFFTLTEETQGYSGAYQGENKK